MVKPVAFAIRCGDPEVGRAVLDRLEREDHLVPAAQRSPYRQVMAAGVPGRRRHVRVRAGSLARPARP